MVSQTYAPAEPDAIAMADALDHPEEDFYQVDKTDAPLPQLVEISVPKQEEGKEDEEEENEETAAPPVYPAPDTFQPSFGLPEDSRPGRAEEDTPQPDVNETSEKAQLMKDTLAGLTPTGRTHAPNQAAPKHPEIKKTKINRAPPAIGTLATVRPDFAGDDPFANAAPALEHAKGTGTPLAAAPVAEPAPREAARPPTISRPAPAVVSHQPATAPVTPAPKPAAPQPIHTAKQVQPSTPVEQSIEIPQNAKKVVTTTTTTTKIVDGQEVVETRVVHNVVVKKKSPLDFLKKKLLGSQKKTTTITTTE